jgi:hypothetical protein
MPEQKPIGGTLPWATLLALLVAGGGAVFLLPQLESSRPSLPSPTHLETISEFDIPARSWQDPFKAVEDHFDTVDPAKADGGESYVVRLFGKTALAVEANRQPDTRPSRLRELQHERSRERDLRAHSIEKLTARGKSRFYPLAPAGQSR